MVLLIVRHYIRGLVQDVMGWRGFARAVQAGELGGADLLRAGRPCQRAAMLGPAVLPRAAGGRQEALGHAGALTVKVVASVSPVHHTHLCRENVHGHQPRCRSSNCPYLEAKLFSLQPSGNALQR